jgi:Family of unknown function (DUF6491)
MKFASASILIAATVLSACSGVPRRESDKELLSRYMSYAAAPVADFHTYSAFDSWSAIDDQHVLIRTGTQDAYLVKVVAPCMNLPFASRIAFTSRFPHTVQSGFDSLRVGRERCRIIEIRPVNYRQMRAEAKEEKGQS